MDNRYVFQHLNVHSVLVTCSIIGVQHQTCEDAYCIWIVCQLVTFHTESTFCPDFRLYAILSFTKSVNDRFNPINDRGSVIRRLIRRNHVRIFLDSKIDVIGSFQGKTLRVFILLEKMVISCEQKSKQINPDAWHLSGCFQSTHVVPTCIYPRGSSTQEFHICPHLWHLQLWQRITFCAPFDFTQSGFDSYLYFSFLLPGLGSRERDQ